MGQSSLQLGPGHEIRQGFRRHPPQDDPDGGTTLFPTLHFLSRSRRPRGASTWNRTIPCPFLGRLETGSWRPRTTDPSVLSWANGPHRGKTYQAGYMAPAKTFGIEREDRLADLLTYLRYAWGKEGTLIDKNAVSSIRRKHEKRTTPWTDEELKKLGDSSFQRKSIQIRFDGPSFVQFMGRRNLDRDKPPLKQNRIRIGQIGLAHPHATRKLQRNPLLRDLRTGRGSRTRPIASQESQGFLFDQLMNAKGLQAVAIETRVKDLVKLYRWSRQAFIFTLINPSGSF